jgi:hypothetical protein
MANLTRTSAPDFDGHNPAIVKISDRKAGVALTKGDLVYLHTDGTWLLGTGAADNAAAKVFGIAMAAASLGEAVTVGLLGGGWRWKYSSGLTIGARYFLGTAGLLADAATTGGTTVLAIALSATDVIFVGIEH